MSVSAKSPNVKVEITNKLGRLDSTRISTDMLGQAYEWLIAKFAAAAGKGGGEFYTPAEVGRLMAGLLDPGEGAPLPSGLLWIGVGLAVEFSPLTKVKTIADARELIAGAGADARTGVIVDTWHFFRGDDEWPDLEALPVDELAFVQFSDGLPAGKDRGHDTLHRRALPGQGEFDLERFSSCLRAKASCGPVSIEVLSQDLRALSVEEFALRTMETSLPYWE